MNTGEQEKYAYSYIEREMRSNAISMIDSVLQCSKIIFSREILYFFKKITLSRYYFLDRCNSYIHLRLGSRTVRSLVKG